MASKLSVSFSGSILIQLSPGVCVAPLDPGQSYTLQLLTANRAGDEQIGQQLSTIDSSAAFAALPYPAGLLGRVLYFRGLGERDQWIVRVTYAVSGAVDIPVQGTLLHEAPDGDEITGVAVQGVGEISWVVWGALV